MTRRVSLKERIERRVQIVAESGCWIWMGNQHPETGYGRIKLDGKMDGAHRVSAMAFIQEEISGKTICHRCDVPICVNPAHLYVGTSKTNTQDMLARGRARPPVGMRSGSAKLTDAQVLAIKSSDRRGVDLAKEFAISKSIISQIRRGQIWQHL